MLLNSSFSYRLGVTRTLLAELLEKGGKGVGILAWECFSSRTRGCQEQRFGPLLQGVGFHSCPGVGCGNCSVGPSSDTMVASKL